MFLLRKRPGITDDYVEVPPPDQTTECVLVLACSTAKQANRYRAGTHNQRFCRLPSGHIDARQLGEILFANEQEAMQALSDRLDVDPNTVYFFTLKHDRAATMRQFLEGTAQLSQLIKTHKKMDLGAYELYTHVDVTAETLLGSTPTAGAST